MCITIDSNDYPRLGEDFCFALLLALRFGGCGHYNVQNDLFPSTVLVCDAECVYCQLLFAQILCFHLNACRIGGSLTEKVCVDIFSVSIETPNAGC